MATQAQISPEQYLSMSFDGPDREYVNGQVLERNVGDEKHSDVQWRLSGIFFNLAKQYPLFGRPELRMRVADSRFRIPDFAVFIGKPPGESVPSQPPFLAIEIISPPDRHSELMARIEEFHAWGVNHLWIIDPALQKIYVYDGGFREVTNFALPEFSLEIRPSDLF